MAKVKLTAKQIFNPIFFVNLLALTVISVQLFTGFFIDPKIQLGILTIINILFRVMTGSPLPVINTDVAPIQEKIDLPKNWYESKMLWISAIGFIGGVVQSLTGWTIPPESYVEIIAGISFMISIITHKAIKIS